MHKRFHGAIGRAAAAIDAEYLTAGAELLGLNKNSPDELHSLF